MSDDMPPTPEGRLIRRARERAIPKVTIRAAAAMIGMSAEQWGYVERGYVPARGGNPPRRFHPPAPTLARMASAMGVTPEELESGGENGGERPDAAERLRDIQPEAPRPQLAEVPRLDMDDALIERFIAMSGIHREALTAMWRSYRGGYQSREFVIGKILDWIADDPSLPIDWDKGDGSDEARNALGAPAG